MSLIYIQRPKPDAIKVIKIIKDRLKQEEHYEDVTKQPSFRANLLRDLIKEIEKENV